MAIASRDSVTVSIAAEMTGMFRPMSAVRRVREVDLAGMDVRVRRKEEDVVERQGQGDRVVGSGSGILRHHAPAAR